MYRLSYIPIVLLLVSCGENHASKESISPEKQVVKLEAKKEQEPTAEKEVHNKSEPPLLKEKTVPFLPPIVDDEEDEVPPPMIDFVSADHNKSTVDQDFWAVEPPPPPPRQQEPQIFDFVDEPAEFPGGMVALREYLSKNYVVPESVKGTGFKGKVFVRFIVSAEGNISNVNVVRGVPDCSDCNKEALRVVRSMPKWIPGKIGGKAVNSYYNLPVRIEDASN